MSFEPIGIDNEGICVLENPTKQASFHSLRKKAIGLEL